MRIRISLITVAVLGLGFATAGTPAQTPKQPLGIAGQDTANDLSVAVGKSVLVDLAEPIKRVAVGLSDVAEATVTSPTEIMVNGKTPGQTSLIIWQASGDRQFFNITVRRNTFESSDRLAAIRHELSISLPGQEIQVSSENGSIFLRGTVNDLSSSERAVQIASTALAPIGNADTTGKTSQGEGGASQAAGKVINLLYVRIPPADRQILLKVRFVSLDRSKAQQLGINLYNLGLGNAIGGVTTGQFSPPTISSSATGSGAVSGSSAGALFSNELNILTYFPGLNVGADIQALETKGIVQTLAQPNVLAVNGKQASFLAGGEYPYPVVQPGSGGTSSVTIQFKEYGVRLNFIPTITPRGTIRLQVAPEVSALDTTNEVQIGGSTVPAITVRKVKTEVELSDKESFAIGGLLDDRESRTFEKIPFIGDVPVLGKLFQSQAKSQTHSELLVIITPELVNPVPAGSPTPSIKFPDKFLSSDSPNPMNTPDQQSPSQQEPTAIPVEKLVESQTPEQPLVIEGSIGGTGSGK